ncbi:DUF58 domain-containing protein [archaeon]|jgi:uncharacterized protein (DUF58 family)|nr:DUF58 domain-containing protein [archaeon]MBT4022955.1 DUF58 domain-containing protein [archaeon]MBT4271946.1 DUF58 domain-containing protein [archaeon]MBT4461784.1 DUF58 domain-containing protein [archaeon]MBT4858201.1 DUF58 domain-containing protein [archaeon]
MPLKKFNANLVPGLKELSMQVKKDLLTTAKSGELASKLKGRGIEFEDYRDYNPADDAHRIDWRASQRSQRLLVREYKLDVNFNAFFLIDTSESMLFSSVKKLKCEYAAEVANSIFYGVLTSGNSSGFGLFNDGVVKLVKPMLGKKQYHLFAKEISDVKNYGGKKDFKKAVRHTLSILDRKTLIFIFSDFIGLEKDLFEYIKLISHVHEVIGVMINDPRDISLPSNVGQLVLQDPFSNETIYVDSNEYSRIYNEYNQKRINIIRAVFQRSRSKLLELNTSKGFYDPTLKFFTQIGARWR